MLQFNNVILHNFGSYNHAEIDLQNKGFCLVTGENHHIKDNALSNGSGKSFIWSGICFAITGETIQGLKSNLKNIYNEEPDAYVTLDFIADGISYTITRYISPKSDLKIIRDSIDISGKGIRESEQKLAEFLPDLTQQLIASTIIIGQGMPNKFSAFKPSGRKELLEKLTKSDFMIEDIKARIASRTTELNTKNKELSDALLIAKTNQYNAQKALDIAVTNKANRTKPDFDKDIAEVSKQLASINKDLAEAQISLKAEEKLRDDTNAKLLEKTTERVNSMTTLNESYHKSRDSFVTAKVKVETEIRTIQTEIKRLEAITDICPTCGQKIPGKIKPDTTNQKNELKEKQDILETVNSEITSCDNKYNDYLKMINEASSKDIAELTSLVNTYKNSINKIRNDINDYSHYADIEKQKLTKLEYDKQNWDNETTTLSETISKLTTEVAELGHTIESLNTEISNNESHLQRVKWLDTLTKRDFRGYILTDIIKYLDAKAKVYAETVFGHKDLNIYLDGNDLDISYNGKMFDNLSGGEKTRVDLIIQFAIRDLLTTYMNAGSNILVLDEVTDFLDATSCDAVMSMIEKELKTVESVFIISHHAEELNLPIDSTLHVNKNSDGISSIVQN